MGRAPFSAPHFQQAIRRWGNSLAVRLPTACLNQAGLREGDQVAISIGEDGRLTLEPMQRLQRSELAEECRLLQSGMPQTPSVIEACRAEERW
jgi:antitoxin MazE